MADDVTFPALNEHVTLPETVTPETRTVPSQAIEWATVKSEWGYVTGERDESGAIIIAGPYPSQEAAEAAANGLDVIAIPASDIPACSDCGATYRRLPMPEAAGRVYDALFPGVLNWREDDDCGMAELMRTVAVAAAAAALENPPAS